MGSHLLPYIHLTMELLIDHSDLLPQKLKLNVGALIYDHNDLAP